MSQVQEKSSVARFPIFHHMQPVAGSYNPLIIPSKSHNHLVVRHYLKKGTFKPSADIDLIQTSHALVATRNGWYAKNGCCASIGHATRDHTARLVYYLPKCNYMGIGKMSAYIRELSKAFPEKPSATGVVTERLSIEGVQTPETFLHPFGVVQGFVRPQLSTSADTDSSVPYCFTSAKEWLLVKARVTRSFENLFYLQFLRSMYQHIGFVPYLQRHMDATDRLETINNHPTGSFMHYYQQPRMYFRLAKLFPKLSRHQLLYLSFCIHGRTISSTYFPYCNWYYGYRNNIDPVGNNLGSINNICSCVGDGGFIRVLDFALLKKVNGPEDIKPAELLLKNKCQRGTGMFEQYAKGTSHILSYLVSMDTFEGYKKAIEVLGVCLEDNSLLEAIK